ncbi:RNA-binding protein [Peteryoungia desertarenae]|uniref:RNA-binding protein n=1 Tax=Peteryoungia desertarenae TaxID=1813451 RepID=A0ABX6QL58_9HYPH|nr:RNA-binding protein [Peteryoungia desertarenae]QLF69002.1 RNA-binding protein [Peteryoungia desertarenae]
MAQEAQDHAGDEADFDDSALNGRMCIATRESGSPETLLRFVAAPDGTIVPDLKRTLPGRGCWISPRREAIEKAVAKKLFARALKRDVKVDPDLAGTVDRLLVSQLTGMMNMARKAGQFFTGAAKVELAVRNGEAIAVFHSLEAAADGIRKIDQARKAWHLGTGAEAEIPSFILLTGAEMDQLMGQNAFIHACALAGQAGEGVVKRANLLETYRGKPSRVASSAGPEPQ